MQHLVGKRVPDVELLSTEGSSINPSKIAGRAVYFIYPYTGKVGHPDPENWDTIAGAHGSTPQALAYAKSHKEFATLHVKIFGVSLLSPQWQSDFAAFHRLPFALLSDAQNAFSKALALPRFQTGGQDFLMRITMVVDNGTIRHVRYPVSSPQDDADECLKWFSGPQ